ncbi:MAG: Acetyl-CoA synthetase (ADP-forming) [Streblomastix strix]|uniref:Acetyl-CoA synthetase (ADP-forming) n=1 Tax=Streblomastix strix TaxID=222440 RepID=A0A5J4WJR2_9EUKA|nr:MAG: Acetyl-CoA synthetase (ADP-forming) [Streblomastix strix]
MEALLNKASEQQNLDEHEVYDFLKLIGIETPPYVFIPASAGAAAVRAKLPQKVDLFVAKVVAKGLIHKTEAKGVLFGIKPDGASAAFQDLETRFRDQNFEGVLFVEQLQLQGSLGDEILVSLFQDSDFGPLIAIGFGGVLVEELKAQMLPNRAQIFLPASMDLDEPQNIQIIENLPLMRILLGLARGSKKRIEINEIIRVLKSLQKVASEYSLYNPKSKYNLEELEINPASVHNGKLLALDGVLRVKKLDSRDSSQSCPMYLQKKPLNKISMLLHPRSVAVAGASSKNANAPGSIMIRKILASGRVPRDQIYVLHPKEKEVEGLPCVNGLEAALESRKGQPLDLLIIAVNAHAASEMLSLTYKIHATESILIVTAGFAETEGGEKIQRTLEHELELLGVQHPERRPVICGPNTLGYISEGGIDTLFTPDYKSSSTMYERDKQEQEKQNKQKDINKTESGVAIISQSGAQLITRQSNLAGILKPALAVSVGNQMDLSATDFFEYLIDEIEKEEKEQEQEDKVKKELKEGEIKKYSPYNNITTVGLYIEGFNPGEGARLIQLVKRAVNGWKKNEGLSVAVYKTGRTPAGRDAAKGHTASLAGDYQMFSFLLRSSGAIVCESFEEFEDVLSLCALMPSVRKLRQRPKYDQGKSSSQYSIQSPIRVGMMSNAGFEKCALADHLFNGLPKCLQLAQWTNQQTREKIEALFNKCGLKGVIDISPVLDVTPTLNELQWVELCEIMINDPDCDICIFSTVPESVNFRVLPKAKPGQLPHNEDIDAPGGFVDKLSALKEKFGQQKPFAVSMESGRLYDHVSELLSARGIPVFRRADSAARALAKIAVAMRKEIL